MLRIQPDLSSRREKIKMKRLTLTLFVLLICGLMTGGPMTAQQHASHAQPAGKAASLMTGLGGLHQPVSTANPEAQKFFDQGLRLIYAFNHEEAARSFQQAAKLDLKLAMAYWGIAE